MSRAADLGAVAKGFEGIVHAAEKKLPRGSSIQVRGQVETMNPHSLGWASACSLPLLWCICHCHQLPILERSVIIITALPGPLCGIVWMLFLTRTTLNVPSLMGAVMSIGVATANSILVVTFAKERLAETGNAFTASLDAGYIRLRPVIMTALAMIIGMVPMALGLAKAGTECAAGQGGVGGLLFATWRRSFLSRWFCMIRAGSGSESDGTANMEIAQTI